MRIPAAQFALLSAGSIVAAAIALGATAAPASAGIFGTNPLNISVGAHGEPPNGPSGGPAISGDNRKARLAAFHSDATNLVAGDTNGARDVFVWHRPHGRIGLTLNRPGVGSLTRVSVTDGDGQANGPSESPVLDGSLTHSPNCVAFVSYATNLAVNDATPDADVYLRDLHRNRTFLLSRGVTAPATDPAISGDCRRVAFAADGWIWTVNTRTRKPHRVRRGSDPDFSLDGKALAWQNDGLIYLRRHGRTLRVAAGTHPLVSNSTGSQLGVAYDDRGVAGLAIVGAAGRVRRSRVAGDGSRVASISAFAPDRGIVTYLVGTGLYYLNRHTGNSDDLAHASSAIAEATASARANFAAFTASGGEGFVGAADVPSVYFKHLVDGAEL